MIICVDYKKRILYLFKRKRRGGVQTLIPDLAMAGEMQSHKHGVYLQTE